MTQIGLTPFSSFWVIMGVVLTIIAIVLLIISTNGDHKSHFNKQKNI